MLWGMSYLFVITGTTDLPEMVVRLKPLLHNPYAVVQETSSSLALATTATFFAHHMPRF